MRKRGCPNRIQPLIKYGKLKMPIPLTNLLPVDQPTQVGKNCNGNDELPNLNGGHEFGHRAGHFDFH